MRKAQYVIRGVHAPAVKFQAHRCILAAEFNHAWWSRYKNNTVHAELQLQKYGV